MLRFLNRTPQNLDDIVERLLDIFIDVEYDELKSDTFDFFMNLADEGYLIYGKTFDTCNESQQLKLKIEREGSSSNFARDNVSVDHFVRDNVLSDDFLQSIHVEVASICNERCVHCYIPHKEKNKIIDSDLFFKIVKDGRAMNIINVTLTGGEPMLHPNFTAFLEKCRNLDLSVNVLSNLTLLTNSIVEEMKKNPLLSVQTSIYSMDSYVHDAITKFQGSWEKTINAVKELISSGIHLQISCPVIKQNKNSFLDVIKWGQKNNIPVVTNYSIFASYDHDNLNLSNRLSLKEIEEVFNQQISDNYMKYIRASAEEKCLLTGDSPICTVCRYYFCISADGDAYPCAGWNTKKLGNVYEQSIEKIWKESQEIQHLRRIKWNNFSKCLSCNDRGYCTVCMMNNENEDLCGDMFKINNFHCKIAAMIYSKVNSYFSLEE